MNPTLEQVIAAITPLWGAQPSTPVQPPVVQPLAQPVPSVVAAPLGFDGLIVSQSIAWAPGINRILSQGFAGTNIWQVSFTTGGPSTRPARLQAAEYESQTAMRQWAIARVSDGMVVASGQDSPTFAPWVSVGNPIYGPTLEVNTAYALFVRNQNGDGGQMSLDLIL